jgi:hypothetical protein
MNFTLVGIRTHDLWLLFFTVGPRVLDPERSERRRQPSPEQSEDSGIDFTKLRFGRKHFGQFFILKCWTKFRIKSIDINLRL